MRHTSGGLSYSLDWYSNCKKRVEWPYVMAIRLFYFNIKKDDISNSWILI